MYPLLVLILIFQGMRGLEEDPGILDDWTLIKKSLESLLGHTKQDHEESILKGFGDSVSQSDYAHQSVSSKFLFQDKPRHNNDHKPKDSAGIMMDELVQIKQRSQNAFENDFNEEVLSPSSYWRGIADEIHDEALREILSGKREGRSFRKYVGPKGLSTYLDVAKGIEAEDRSPGKELENDETGFNGHENAVDSGLQIDVDYLS